MARNDQPIWFKGRAAQDWVTRFTVGNDYVWDTLLLPYDIEATRAHARGLVSARVLDEQEFNMVDSSLTRLHGLAESGEITVSAEDEDCHSVIERFVTEELGDVGKKIHTGRSRNDQVVAALRLFLREQLLAARGLSVSMVEGLCDLAESNQLVVMPGYTHMQRAMPTTLALWAAGYAELLVDDVLGFMNAIRSVSVSPLGSAAGYGVPFLALPREDVARELDFDRIHVNATSAQLSRGKVELGVAHACVQLSSTLNRLASDLILYSTAEFGFVKLPEEYTTGSSIMPQKRNPDVLELARATHHRLVGEMHVLASITSNLPSGYHRDLQLTKDAVMRVTTTTLDLLAAMGNVMGGLVFDIDRMRAACTPELLATARALKLVTEGIPFRDAYRQAAAGVGADAEMPDDLAEMYALEGYPGRASVGTIRARLADVLAAGILSE